ncbi:MAG: PAS domain S-box protein [Desulfobulbus sp.]|nr:PAS domain S-box protein [Desulfobulbus sp.]
MLSVLPVVLLYPHAFLHASVSNDPVKRGLKVVMDNNYPPYCFVNSGGQVTGILVDQWRLWQKKTGISVEIVAKEWNDVLRDMKAGKYDVIDTVFETEERKTWLDFGQPYARIEVSAYFAREITGITTVDSLKGFVVALKEGDAAYNLLRDHGVDNLVLFKGYESIVQAAGDHKINVFVIDNPPALYYLYKYGLQSDFKMSPPLTVGRFQRAVRKGNTALLNTVEEGFAGISPEELASIDRKWSGSALLDEPSFLYFLVGSGSLGLMLVLLFFRNRSLLLTVRKRTTELEKSRGALEKSELRYRELVEQAGSIILRMDREGRICFFNEYAQNFFGYRQEEVIGRSVIGTIVPETDKEGTNMRRMIEDLLHHPRQYAVHENENMCSDDRRVWIVWANTPLFDAQGRYTEVLSVGNDVTDRKMAEQALHREQDRLEFVLNGLRLGIWEWNVQTNQTVFSALWAELIGYSLEELIPFDYTSWERLLHPDDADRVQATLFAYVEGRAPAYDCEYRMRHKDGHWVWILDRGRVFTRDTSGKPEWIFGVHADITSIKQAEETMLADSGLLAQFIRNSPIYAYINEVTPTESRCLKASDNFQDLLGIPVAEIPGKTMTELFDRQLADRIIKTNWEVVSLCRTVRSTDVWGERTYSTIKFPIHQGERRLLGGFTIDITDIMLAEAALRESEATFRNIVQETPMGIHLYELKENDNLVFVGANPAADRIIGVDNTQYVGMTIEEVFPDLHDTDVPGHFRRVARHGETWQSEYVLNEDGRITRAFEIYAFQIARGRVVVLFNEISSRKQAEEEQEKLQAQLAQAQKMESVGRLAGGVAHDFNNMLGVILGHCELAMRDLTKNHEVSSSLQHIRTAAERSADLTRQLLAFARRQPIAPKVLDINTTVAGMLQMLERLIGEDVHLVWRPGKRCTQVRIDPSQLDQILANLCVNARDAIHGTGTITIETAMVTTDEQHGCGHLKAVPGSYIMLSVSDDGCGMDAAALPHLFEPFYTTKEMGKGTGLGLAMVYGIVQQNRGTITVDSAPGEGTTVRICLPCHDICGDQHVEEPAGQVLSGSETVLIVEDEPLIRKVVTDMLESLGYTVLPTSGPMEAIRSVQEYPEKVDVLLTDVIMPEMNGRQLAGRLQHLVPGLRCLFMSGYTADVIARHGVLDEGVHFIQKPFTMQVLAGKIREVLTE